jgi:hypothetical protein
MRACCCPARPTVKVMMPATASRPTPVDLLLCGHHYHVSRQALAGAGARCEPLITPTNGQPAAGMMASAR